MTPNRNRMTRLRHAALGTLAAAALALPLAPDAARAQGVVPIVTTMGLDSLSCPRSTVRLGVLGDSLADGLWGAVQRALGQCGSVEVLRLTQVSDGLTHTPPEEWIQRFNAATQSTDAQDVFIVQIGANDLRPLRDDRSRVPYGTPEWDTLYAKRVGELASALSDRADRLLWVGLPVVGEGKFEPEYQHVNALISQTLTALNLPFHDIRELSRFGAEDFAMNAVVNGSTRQLRAPDKIHFTPLGYELIAAALAPEIKDAMATRERKAIFGNAALQ
ncbi:hypothetical protein PSM7751_02244 [Pseudooceanicola marinus]|uniref:Uncharacterized protein n=1 Tax=Pseudooceanicola marinus TaxID=396013 RepID=A0A1X6ZDB8_9RHOB|nr:GDSL-type esterase/lipase family protein [Pseudooceanicola marinus]PJE28298.1 DUF459 domain-containing protein [Pseudooceanicola marinus]SLN47561.1 hypothetical protein PSM7751_02244 [Pseudooceanicola marinus]